MYIPSGPLSLIPQVFFSALKGIAYTLAAPFLLIAVLAALVVVLLDFTLFRIRETLHGNPHPKALWEF